MIGRFLIQVLKGIEKVNGYLGMIAMGLLVVTTLTVFYAVFTRFVLNICNVWTWEITVLVQVILPMLALSWVLKEGGHIHVELLLDRLRPTMQGWFQLLISTLCIIFCGVMAWISWNDFQFSLATGEQSTETRMPYAPMRLIIFVGFILFALQFVVRSYKYFHHTKKQDNS